MLSMFRPRCVPVFLVMCRGFVLCIHDRSHGMLDEVRLFFCMVCVLVPDAASSCRQALVTLCVNCHNACRISCTSPCRCSTPSLSLNDARTRQTHKHNQNTQNTHTLQYAKPQAPRHPNTHTTHKPGHPTAEVILSLLWVFRSGTNILLGQSTPRGNTIIIIIVSNEKVGRYRRATETHTDIILIPC